MVTADDLEVYVMLSVLALFLAFGSVDLTSSACDLAAASTLFRAAEHEKAIDALAK